MIKTFHGECLEVIKHFDNDSIDALITDPPAGISFMGKKWDAATDFIPNMKAIFEECLRVLKPGAHGLVWALPRTSHWTATALEQAGFEIRDVVNHIFGSGFPKSLDVSKAIDKAVGIKREQVPLQRCDGTTRFNKSSKKSVGFQSSINYVHHPIGESSTREAKQWEGWGTALKPAHEHWILVRKPLGEKTVAKNVIKHGTGGLNIDGCRIDLNGGANPSIARYKSTPQKGNNGWDHSNRGVNFNPEQAALGRFPANLVLSEEAAKELGEPSRFFYVSKASKSDKGSGNIHPTVKSTKLMEYLINLITPPNGTVLDPFMGSGSTGVAAQRLGFDFVGIEREIEYLNIAESRFAKNL